MFGGIEAGGIKFHCGVGNRSDDLEIAQFPTTTPAEILDKVVEFFKQHTVSAVGLASFGSVDLDISSSSYGYITSTPKPGWLNCDLVGDINRALRVPVGFDTDVNGAVLGEPRWGAARGWKDAVYIVIGTGIGGGALVGGRVVHGLVDPEMGHLRIPHDIRDSFAGNYPYHGDCFGRSGGVAAMQARWANPPANCRPIIPHGILHSV